MIYIGPYTYQPRGPRIKTTGDWEKLSYSQGRLLDALIASPATPVSYDQLADALWPEIRPRVWKRAIRVQLSRMRQKLVQAGGARNHIVSVNYDGYMLRIADGAITVRLTKDVSLALDSVLAAAADARPLATRVVREALGR